MSFFLTLWMDVLRFYVFLTVLQSYQDDVRVVMGGLCNGTVFIGEG